jgi:hypothetical protein
MEHEDAFEAGRRQGLLEASDLVFKSGSDLVGEIFSRTPWFFLRKRTHALIVKRFGELCRELRELSRG